VRTIERPDRAGREDLVTKSKRQGYTNLFYLPGGLIYAVLFLVPTTLAFFYAFTRWTLFDWEWIGLENFRQFFRDPPLTQGLINTFIYTFLTTTVKVVLGFAIGLLVTSRIRLKGTIRALAFFPVLVSTVAVGITFKVLMDPSTGAINSFLGVFGIDGPAWLTDPDLVLYSVSLVDIWKGTGISMVIFIAGILSVPGELLEAVSIDGGSARHRVRHVILPLSWPATSTVVLLSFISGLRSFDLIQTMTGGGPGFESEVIASSIYKQYQAGFYGLATAGNVVLFVMVIVLVAPLQWLLARGDYTK
jgi:raffinose/stachyose/melibiose transport system permease protein